MGRLHSIQTETPHCPMCEGPCKHEFERGPWVFPDRLPRTIDTDPANATADPDPVKVKKPNTRGRRAHHGPEEDRAHAASEDR